MVVIRLTRKGTNKRPFYHVVVADRRRAAQGRFIELLGYFNPIAQEGSAERLLLKLERLKTWIEKGAQPSPRVKQLIKTYSKMPQTTEAAA